MNAMMTVTLDFVEALLVRGWEIRFVNKRFQYRDPNGISGSDYQSDTLQWFPPAVAKWIIDNVPRVMLGHGVEGW